jgi:hypothetical protein
LRVEIDWRTVLAANDGYQVRPPVAVAELDRAAVLLGAVLPDDLRRLYLTTDGIFDTPGQWFVVWPLVGIVAGNQRDWAVSGVGRRALLGFGDDGTGASFCVPATAALACSSGMRSTNRPTG